MSTENKPTQRSQVKRLPQRADYELQTIYNILDEGLICYVGFVVNNQPFVIPTAYGRLTLPWLKPRGFTKKFCRIS
ncbi:hypothetical protein NIES4071_57270 [Calothrix sp. NIES-4071]|nr:hypothetical protein NIES4071_57270 [Calothrix sp. NIES-4071]BAZ60034.1 hypothetical protein NIES4105_57220 [Calothrix sp. NIES-4105]